MGPKQWALFSQSPNALERRDSVEDWSPADPCSMCDNRNPPRPPPALPLASYLSLLSSPTLLKPMDVEAIVPQLGWPDTISEGGDSGSEDQPLDLSLNRSSPDSSATSQGSTSNNNSRPSNMANIRHSQKRKSSDSVTSSASNGISSPLSRLAPPSSPPIPLLNGGPPAKRTYTEEELQAALRDIQAGKLGTRRAAVIYGIPRSTLRNKVYKLANDKRKAQQEALNSPPVNLTDSTDILKSSPSNGAASESLRQLLKSTITQKTIASPMASSSGDSCSPPLAPPLIPALPNMPVHGDPLQIFHQFISSIQHLALTGSLSRNPAELIPSDKTLPELFKHFSAHEKLLEEQMATSINLKSNGFAVAEGLEGKLQQHNGILGKEQLHTKNVVKSDKQLGNQKKEPNVTPDGKVVRPKRGRYRNYNRDNLLQAVNAVQRGEMSVHRAGTFFGVPHSTLEYKVKERHLLRPKKRIQKVSPSTVPSSTPAPTQPITTSVPLSLVPPNITGNQLEQSRYPWCPASLMVPPPGGHLPPNGNCLMPGGVLNGDSGSLANPGNFFATQIMCKLQAESQGEGGSTRGSDDAVIVDGFDGRDGGSVLEKLIKSTLDKKVDRSPETTSKSLDMSEKTCSPTHSDGPSSPSAPVKNPEKRFEFQLVEGSE